MSFFTSAIDTLQILVVALGAGLGAWGVINLLEGYGNDNPGAKSQGMKQLMDRSGRDDTDSASVGLVLIVHGLVIWLDNRLDKTGLNRRHHRTIYRNL